MATLFERIGGSAVLDAAIDRFYVKVFEDPLLQPFFVGVDVHTLYSHQKRFLAHAFGGPMNNTGRSLAVAHQKLVSEMALGDRHFDAARRHLLQALSELGVSEELAAEAGNVVESVRNDVLGR